MITQPVSLFQPLIWFLVLYSFCASGQTQQELKYLEKDKIVNLFKSNYLNGKLTDTAQLVAFSIKVKVDNENWTVKTIELSDTTTATHYFKNFDFLKTVNYMIFAPNRTNPTFIFPVMIGVFYPGKRPSEMELTNILNRKISSYLFSNDPLNEPTEDYIYLPLFRSRVTSLEDL